MKIRNLFEYCAVAGLLGLCRILPKSWVYALFAGLGALSYPILLQRRKLALKNTEIAFPEKSKAERKGIVRRHFFNLAESMATNTLITSGRITNEELFDMVEVDNWELLEQSYEAAETGLLVYSAHLGNWELLPQYLALRMKNRLNVISRASNNPLLEKRIIRPLRERFGVHVFYKKNALLNMRKAFRKKEAVGLLVDQWLNLYEGVVIRFFGRHAGTTSTPAIMQIRLGATVVPLFMVKTGKMKYRLIIEEPVEWTDNGMPLKKQATRLTRVHQGIIEEAIKAYPDQWFWIHNRWGLKDNEL